MEIGDILIITNTVKHIGLFKNDILVIDELYHEKEINPNMTIKYTIISNKFRRTGECKRYPWFNSNTRELTKEESRLLKIKRLKKKIKWK